MQSTNNWVFIDYVGRGPQYSVRYDLYIYICRRKLEKNRFSISLCITSRQFDTCY